MKLKYLFFTLFVSLYLNGISQFTFPTIDAASSGMGGTSVALSGFWSGVDNISALTSCKAPTIGISFSESFMLSQLSYKTLVFATPISKVGAMALRYTHFGNTTYSEQRISAAYSQSIGKHIAIGIELDYLYCGTNDVYYDTYHRFTFSAGTQVYPTDELCLGFHVFNPFGISLNKDYNQTVPAVIKLGVGYHITSRMLATVEVEKNIYMRHNIKTGIEYRFGEHVFTRLGFNSSPIIYTFGMGVKRNSWAIDISSQIHTQLGASPAISLTYSI